MEYYTHNFTHNKPHPEKLQLYTISHNLRIHPVGTGAETTHTRATKMQQSSARKARLMTTLLQIRKPTAAMLRIAKITMVTTFPRPFGDVKAPKCLGCEFVFPIVNGQKFPVPVNEYRRSVTFSDSKTLGQYIHKVVHQLHIFYKERSVRQIQIEGFKMNRVSCHQGCLQRGLDTPSARKDSISNATLSFQK